MPKTKSSFSLKVSNWVASFNSSDKEIFTTDGKVVLCTACNKKIPCERKFQLYQHAKTESHLTACHAISSRQAMLTPFCGSNEDNFNKELCFAFVASGIPLWNLTKPPFRDFYLNTQIRRSPVKALLEKKYIKECYLQTIATVKQKIGKNYIYVMIDETTDPRGLYVANMLVGILSDVRQKPFLIACKQLEKTNHETVSRFVNDSLKIISIDAEISDRVILLVTDAATYMVKAGKFLQVLFPNMIHVTCMAHACSRLAEKIRDYFPKVNKLVNNGKKMFLKAPSRINKYKEIMVGMPLPPVPVITRWGTWLESAIFYANNFVKFKTFVDEIKSVDDAQCVQKLNLIIIKPSISNELAFIDTNLKFLVDIIKKFEERNLSLDDGCQLVKKLKDSVNDIPGEAGLILQNKIKDLLSKDVGLSILEDINKVLNGDTSVIIDKIRDPLILSKFKNAPLTSVEVERSFSIYKHLLTDKRHSFTECNLEMYLVVNYNSCIENYEGVDSNDD